MGGVWIGLFSYEAITAGTAFRVAITGITDVDFAEGAIIACAVVLTIGNATADAFVYFTSIFVHHNKKSSFKGTSSMRNFQKIIDILENFLYNSVGKEIQTEKIRFLRRICT